MSARAKQVARGEATKKSDAEADATEETADKEPSGEAVLEEVAKVALTDQSTEQEIAKGNAVRRSVVVSWTEDEGSK